jgi:hypothetical protein
MQPSLYSLIYSSWILLWPRQCFATLPNGGLESWSVSLDFNNASALQSVVNTLRDKYFAPAAASPLQRLYVPPQGRLGLPLVSRPHLQGRQTCTGNADNHCFAVHRLREDGVVTHRPLVVLLIQLLQATKDAAPVGRYVTPREDACGLRKS